MPKFKNQILIILVLASVSCIQHKKKDILEKSSTTSNSGLQLGIIDTIYSKMLNQERELIIYIPESAKDPNRKRKQYPVVYLLDGRYNFVPFVGMLKQYSEMHDTKILPEMIVVGISNINNESRMMDFSPTTARKPKQFGGGSQFLEFIKTELFPYIEQNYSGAQHRTIIGHSFGGLVVMHALTKHPEMFDNYLLIDGSLYFDNNLFLNNPTYSLTGKQLQNKNLYIAIANTATYGSHLESIKKDTITANKYVRHSLDLVDQINYSDTNLNTSWKYYNNDTHGSTAYLAQLDGLRFFYSWFEFKEEHKYRSKFFVPKTSDDHFASLTKKHFNKVSQKLGYTFKPDKNWVSSNASMLLNYHKLPKQALENYELNIGYYPNRPGVFKDLADFYLLQNDTVLAKKYYTKTLELENNPNIQSILTALEN
ncbi:alpha/beta hydrolase-fold protein [Winogradskyella psychrotolerans]|uniref:alpha/beta hydrolase-fold protein n=1 Tax=Winogradskyella psychrotolerans TaxID=1344585 RepID=UPI001C07E9FA|nr:alpha/beta hydrolase-fold protein [Winogradskyella psychrotolerans]MBU2930023.1 prolyl oligopeptidase family serine peptidase [Winogradskyella psychrotolerans]